jgi:hypothetical protein
VSRPTSPGPPVVCPDALPNHRPQVAFDRFPVALDEHDRHRLRFGVVEEAQAGEHAAGVDHAEASLVAVEHVSEGHPRAQGMHVDEVFLRSALRDRKEFHCGKIRAGSQPAADLRPFHERLEERMAELEKAHLHPADPAMHRLGRQRRGLERDAAGCERLPQIDRMAREPRGEPVEIDRPAMADLERHGRAAGKVKTEIGRGRCERSQAGGLRLRQHLRMDHDAALPSQMRRSGVASQVLTRSSGRPITVSQKRS